ncbi:RNA polymerase sigma factor [Sediminibacterium ginsengisoli]|uniref:RNA polymerase sigma-70 factor, ECF subfamily n=1 Tax=Sediminibacterium ginsengisoli TaxID=413434 RepID=A0A1T4KC17_9BACT|nr:sigma-70 family RNA polymerase sigma factor [Sediminibacterium ginsengisoli]SJZ39969.1 RNA polymerase sigma-70 factor, ECF subfamily [Sediminibacterium ginsengisoli]
MDLTNQLIQDCIKGQRHAQTRLYELFASAMYTVCLRYADSREDAEDILQEGFLNVFQHLGQFRGEGSFEGWIRTIMINCALQRYRNRGQLQIVSSDSEEDDGLYVHEEDITSRIEVKTLIGMIQQLPPACRMVFNLYVFEGMKHREIAAYLGVSEGTSKSNLSDARRMLQKAITRKMNVVSL